MLPRRSSVIRVVFFIVFTTTVTFLLLTGPESRPSGSTWRRLLQDIEMYGVNETEVRIEFDSLKVELNETVSAQNKSLDELYQYVKAMRNRVPVNPHKFDFIINPTHVCADKDIYLVTYVHTAPSHYKKRAVIRETWGNPRVFPSFNYRVVFLMGTPNNNASMQQAILMESDIYGDIVQENFIDSYRNLTYKGIMGLRWVSQYCKHATFVLKTDDDIYVNIFNVINHLQSVRKLEPNESRKMLLCLVWYRMKVVRDPKSKWYIPYSEFHEQYFPTYCSGSAFIMSTDLVADLYNASLFTPFFWVDDFYVTGLLAKKVGVVHQKFNSVYSLGPSTFMEKFSDPSKWRTLTFGHVHNMNNMVKVWRRVEDDHFKGNHIV